MRLGVARQIRNLLRRERPAGIFWFRGAVLDGLCGAGILHRLNRRLVHLRLDTLEYAVFVGLGLAPTPGVANTVTAIINGERDTPARSVKRKGEGGEQLEYARPVAHADL